jgi:hypothetical protein
VVSFTKPLVKALFLYIKIKKSRNLFKKLQKKEGSQLGPQPKKMSTVQKELGHRPSSRSSKYKRQLPTLILSHCLLKFNILIFFEKLTKYSITYCNFMNFEAATKEKIALK